MIQQNKHEEDSLNYNNLLAPFSYRLLTELYKIARLMQTDLPSE